MSDGDRTSSGDIAIIGMAGRFPGARNVGEFWQNLVNGVESIRQLADEELLRAGVSRRELADPAYVKACPILEDVDKFDAAFFGISPLDASVMDPAHRFFLEVAWQALEDSGNTGLPEEGRVGVFATSGAPLYWMNNVRSNRQIMEAMGEFLVRHTSNDMNFLATRTSYQFDLRGPSLNIQTACSSALVAAHVARKSLLARECDMAMIGGSTINNPMGHGYHYKEGEILSPDGHCRPFDHRSAGTVFGSGTACLVLKRLDDALDNGDTIHAIIKGSAINNDGSLKVGYLAPSVDGQVVAIRDALADAGLNARDISYVEAHGTGTSVGDPIELTALEQAYREHTPDNQFCGVGSVKSNIGHLGEAAAAASLIKVTLALKHRLLPPSLGFEAPNPRFAMEDSPFYVNASLQRWNGHEPLRAGITALGAGGTNCHLILEEPPPALPGEGGRDCQLIVLSAKTRTALERMSENLAHHLEQRPDADFGDAAYTLAMGRRPLAQRRVLVAKDRAEAIERLRSKDALHTATIAADGSDPEVVFTFPGGGAQYARMGIDLYENEAAYRDALNECLAIIDELEPQIRALLFAAETEADAATKKLERPSLTLPTLFAVEYALAKLFQSWGLRPAAFIGHSMGEYVAACLAGVFSLHDGLRLVHLRGRLFERTQNGRMIGVSLPEAELRALMPAGLSIAAVNAPTLCVASGPSESIDALTQLLVERDIDWTPIHIDVAAHSALLDPILDEFRRFCHGIAFNAPRVPIASNYSGQWLTAAEACDPDYWVRHLRNTVRFADCVETVLEGGHRVFLEIGPGRTLTTLVGAQRTKVRNAVNCMRHPKEAANDVEYALLTLGKVWAAGAHADWTALYDQQLRNRIPLPVYPFEGQSYWIEPKAVQIDETAEPVKRENLDNWFATQVWEPAPLVPADALPAKSWLIFAHDKASGAALRDALRKLDAECDIVMVNTGPHLRRIDVASFEVKPGDADQYRALLETLKNEGRAPEHVVMFVKVPSIVTDHDLRSAGWRKHRTESVPTVPNCAPQVDAAFFAPVHLAQALGSVLDAAAFSIVGENVFSVRGEAIDPMARLSIGPAQVISRELPDFQARLIDLGPAQHDPARHAALIQQLARELAYGAATSAVALRAPARWTPQLRSLRLPAADVDAGWLEDDDVVLITGGLGGIGLVIAEYLAKRRKINLALLSREGLPSRADWKELAEAADMSALLKQRIESVRRLEALGARVLPVRGDVTDTSSLNAALSEIRTEMGPINIVIHAAGVMDDELFLARSDDRMRRVLAPKIQGTLNLDTLVGAEPKTFILMSSIASFLGLPGQIDYTAANAFLDAFAEDRQRRKSARTLVINWNAWRDVGMIIDAGGRAHGTPLPAGRTQHPWLDAGQATPRGVRYFTDFSIATHWLLSEHRIEGAAALIPGTGFVELARAACAEAMPNTSGKVIELRQVTFLNPFQVAPDQTRRLQIDVEHADGLQRVTLRSADTQEIHMTAEATLRNAIPAALPLDALQARCTREVRLRDGYLDQDFVRFGPRWQNLDAIRLGTDEALITLALRDSFAQDIGTLAYHPALLDMATGAAQYLIPLFNQAADFLVPFGYDRIVMNAPATARMFSHVRLRAGSTNNVATFDIRVCDPGGAVLIEIEGFTMKRVGADAAIVHKVSPPHHKHNAELEALLREAITPAEGVIAFDRAMTQTEAVQVVASSVDVNVWLRKLERDVRRLKGDDAAATPAFARPALGSDYVKPMGELEMALAAIWSKLLGVADVGVLDDFFELGGNSLIAVRFFTKVKKEFAVSLPLSTLFQAPTIQALAALMRAQGHQEKSPVAQLHEPMAQSASVTAISARSADAANITPPLLIRPGHGRPPVFFVHDGLGEVLLYRSLALKLHPEHAVYGLDPETLGGRFLHTRIVDMARAKVERLRSVQPRGPYLLTGLCAGGVIAFEMARQLQDAGERVAFVGIIDAADVKAREFKFRIARERLDRVRDVLKPSPDETLLSHIGGVATAMSRKTLNFARYTISSRIEHMRNARKVSELRSQPATTGDESSTTIDFIKLYAHAHEEHEPHGLFRGGDVVLFRATQEFDETGDMPFREIYADPLLGWQCRVDAPVVAVDVPGGHSSALQEPHVHTLALDMQSAIDRALMRDGGNVVPEPLAQFEAQA